MSGDRFAAAQAALNAGNQLEGLDLLEREFEADPAAPLPIYRSFVVNVFRLRQYERAERWARGALEIYPRDAELWNVLGVALRRLTRREEAIEALGRAVKLDPKNLAIHSNLGNVLNDLRDSRAVDVFSKLVRQKPTEGEWQRQLGRAYWYAGDLQKAEMRLNLAVKLAPRLLDGWLDLQALTQDLHGLDATITVLERATAALPTAARLNEARVSALRRAGRLRDADAVLQDLLKQSPDTAWIHFQLGGVVSDYDRPRANEHLRKAIELDPTNLQYRVALAESLGRSRFGDEAANLEEGYQTIHQALEMQNVNFHELEPGHLKVATELVGRLAAFDDLERFGTFDELGRKWTENGRHSALLLHLGRIKTDQDRLDLLEHHRIWGRLIEKAVATRPIERRGPRAPNGKIRIGFMSSDLRAHPVAYFAWPLFQHYDRSKFEIYCYSFYQGEADALQKQIAGWTTFRWEQDIGDREAAQMIADDQLDMLIELGGSTHMNKLPVMAYKPAPLQASWLGYPHSAGLEEIDHLILDPYVMPTSRDLLIEEPLLMPKSWIAMGERAFPERPMTPGTPQERNGYLTFGTANNPYKYNRQMLQTWARAVAATPGSRFLFVRPECGSPTFRRNICEIFENQGVSADRISFEPIRGQHMPFYNEIDLSLDSFPQTGGTTTCEALWMGVPVVTVAGEAMFERLSHSILNNAGLGDLSTSSPEEMIETALKLANDHERRKHLRAELRSMLKASPLGQTQQFAVDFYAMIERAVRERGLAPAVGF